MDLHGRVIAITGASSGIGRATALACARAGMHVAVMARREDKLRDVCAQIESIGTRSAWFVGDVTEAGANERFLESAERDLGPVYAAYANAGIGLERETSVDTLDQFREIMEINAFSSLDLVTRAVERFKSRGEGHAIFCSSCLSKVGLPFYAAYCASKAVQDHAARAMRHELAGTGVLVSSVHPVGTSTELFDTMKSRGGGKPLRVGTPEGVRQPPEKVATAIVRQMRRGKGGEIWTSVGMRASLALLTLLPGAGDAVIAKMLRSRSKSV